MKKRLVSVLLCMAMMASMLAGCGAKEAEETTEAETTEEAAEETTEAAEETLFTKALADVDVALAPLPAKDTGVELGAIESTLSNSFWVTMQEGYEDAAAEYSSHTPQIRHNRPLLPVLPEWFSSVPADSNHVAPGQC